MEGLIMAAQLLLGLTILVGLHELGHLLAAKAFGMRVEKYSIGFPPKIFGIKYGETEYSLGAIPLGGFVKISGMVDESLDTENLKEEPQSWEFRAKPAWQRLIVMLGGIIFNVITGIVIFIFYVYTHGEAYIPREEVNRYGIVAHEIGQELGLQTGDRIVKVNGQEYEKFNELISTDVLLGNGSYYTVERNGEVFEVTIPSDFIERMSDRQAAANFIEPRWPFEVQRVEPGSNAAAAGLEQGDKIVGVQGDSIRFFDELKNALTQKEGQMVSMAIQRNGEVIEKEVQVSQEGTIGFMPRSLLNIKTEEYTFTQAVPRGTGMAFEIVWVNVRALGKILTGEISAQKSLTGPIGMAQIFGGTWDWSNFWRITGLISMVLAFMNLLPIPALDGGHVAFLSYEIVSGRKPSDKVVENSQKVGMVILLALMVFVIFNDVFKMIF
jgi:regulator of sigma E protease